MTDVQKALFDIFQAFDAVAKELEIPYFLVCGSALGAIKYQGFIPWDDDLDIGMLREDYERFLKEAPAHLPEHLFLQNANSDPAFPQLYSKLRDSRTTFLEKPTAKLPIHHGLYLDLFPLDGYPDGVFAPWRLELQKRISQAILFSALDIPRSARARLICRILRLLGFHKRTARTVRRLNHRLSRYPADASELLCNHGNWQGRLEYAPKDQYRDGVQATFEGIPVRVPADFDSYLTQKYGDWRADLPPERQKSHHEAEILDVHRPYTDYVPKHSD